MVIASAIRLAFAVWYICFHEIYSNSTSPLFRGLSVGITVAFWEQGLAESGMVSKGEVAI
jgi:hypothetical protein